jgi:hypothetical protein
MFAERIDRQIKTSKRTQRPGGEAHYRRWVAAWRAKLSMRRLSSRFLLGDARLGPGLSVASPGFSPALNPISAAALFVDLATATVAVEKNEGNQ